MYTIGAEVKTKRANYYLPIEQASQCKKRKCKRKGRLINRVLGHMPLPIIGNIHHAYGYSPEELWRLIYDMLNTYYPIMKNWVFTKPNVFTSQPDDMEKMLNSTKHNVKNYTYKPLHSWLGDGLLTSKERTCLILI
ncbi:PREDICTED: cytochrome P450 4d2-like [Dinoponera quadriceps]|uniref:Cytochrome P450 4d2-like n=1 Tax=Dinoponera quadriceps TaxID=609295 RepID=A0A6P3Y7E3_DINQU|nr:PREDICTED: cytochrome P450 4d2-like [Dinoponera quadriceps]